MLLLLLVSNIFAFDITCPAYLMTPFGNLLGGINDLSMYMSDTEEHPFPEACENYEKIQTPNQNIYNFSLEPQDANGNQTQKFFSLLRNRIKETIDYQKERAKNEKSCIQAPGGSVDSCIDASPVIKRMLTSNSSEDAEEVDFPFSRVVKEARFHLSLAQSPSALGNLFNGGAKSDINIELVSYGTHKAEDWKPMDKNSQEFTAARSLLQMYFADGEELTRGMPTYSGMQQRKIRNLRKDALAAHRMAHLATYQTIMSAHPVLQYITSASPDSAEVSGAIDSVLASIEKEENWFQDKTAGLDEGELSTSLLSLLNYSGEVMGILNEHPEFCSLVKKWITLRDAKEMGFDVSAGLLVMGGSFLFPPAFAVTGPMLLGVGAGAGYVAYDSVRKRSTKFQVEGRMNGRADPAVLRQLTEEDVQRINVFIMSFMGSGARQLPFIKRLFPAAKPAPPPASK
jgi:hypothetical protein